MEVFFVVVFFLFGATIGSFLNVVILRLPKRMKFFSFGARSKCPVCKRKLEPRDLIPIVSFLALHGRCRHCKKHISRQYIIVETLTAIAFAGLYLAYGLQWQLLFAIAVLSFTIPLFVIDARHKIIPDSLSIPFIVVCLIVGLLSHVLWYEILIGGAVGTLFFLLQWLISRGKWIGSGDIRLGAAMGFLLGWKYLLVALALAYFSGTIVGITALLLKHKKLKSTIAFGPYLLAGMLVAFFWGAQILHWYLAIYIYPV